MFYFISVFFFQGMFEHLQVRSLNKQNLKVQVQFLINFDGNENQYLNKQFSEYSISNINSDNTQKLLTVPLIYKYT